MAPLLDRRRPVVGDMMSTMRELADDATRTFRTGTLHQVRNPPTIADGLRTPYLGRITWPVIRERVAEMVTVTETAMAAREAMSRDRLHETRSRVRAP